MGRIAYGGGRTTCESCKSLDVRRWHREGRLQAGQSFPVSWTYRGEPSGSISVWTETGSVILTFSWRGSGGSERKSIEQRVPIVWTRCHFGGRRPWFQCTAFARGRYCGRHVAKLYLGGSAVFACRHCHGLAYSSQQESPRDRSVSQAQKLREQLGGSVNLLDDPFPEKPRGMHWRRYDRLRRRGEALEARANALLTHWLRRTCPSRKYPR